MPIYEYKCDKCKAVLERYESLIDNKEPPTCCEKQMEKKFSIASFDFRGSGFYQNDYGNGAHKLGTTEQAQRASIDCEKAGIVAARPQPAGPRLADKLVKHSREVYGN